MIEKEQIEESLDYLKADIIEATSHQDLKNRVNKFIKEWQRVLKYKR